MTSVWSFTDSRSNTNGFLSKLPRKSRWFRHSDADIDDLELEDLEEVYDFEFSVSSVYIVS